MPIVHEDKNSMVISMKLSGTFGERTLNHEVFLTLSKDKDGHGPYLSIKLLGGKKSDADILKRILTQVLSGTDIELTERNEYNDLFDFDSYFFSVQGQDAVKTFIDKLGKEYGNKMREQEGDKSVYLKLCKKYLSFTTSDPKLIACAERKIQEAQKSFVSLRKNVKSPIDSSNRDKSLGDAKEKFLSPGVHANSQVVQNRQGEKQKRCIIA